MSRILIIYAKRIVVFCLMFILLTSCRTASLLSDDIKIACTIPQSSFCYIPKKNSSIFLFTEKENIVLEGYVDNKWILRQYSDTLRRNTNCINSDSLFIGKLSYLKNRNGFIILKSKNSTFTSKLIPGDSEKLQYYRNKHYSDSLIFIEQYKFPIGNWYDDQADSMTNKDFKAFILEEIIKGKIQMGGTTNEDPINE